MLWCSVEEVHSIVYRTQPVSRLPTQSSMVYRTQCVCNLLCARLPTLLR
jgi:hypothetical protein